MLQTTSVLVKTAYAAGAIDALADTVPPLVVIGSSFLGYNAQVITAAAEAVRDKFIRGVTADQLRDGLNVFYADFRNRKIRLPVAVYIILAQIVGVPSTDDVIADFRARE